MPRSCRYGSADLYTNRFRCVCQVIARGAFGLFAVKILAIINPALRIGLVESGCQFFVQLLIPVLN